tara:strand:+ start:532 stop:846 length:315 start_codon:yes stop_codon:yes gene_type:complete
MSLDHTAIYKAYAGIVYCIDGNVAFDKDNNPVTLDQSKIDAARATLDAEYASLEYSRKRSEQYVSIQEQLDLLWHDIDEGKLDKTGGFYNAIKGIKDRNPKPSS